MSAKWLSLILRRSSFLGLIALGFLLLTPPAARAQGGGIGFYDLLSPADLSVPFDYDGNGKADHLVLYRPGTGIIWILANSNGNFAPVFMSQSGIGGYDLLSSADRIFALDYLGTGHADHLVLYRPGTGIIWILANSNGNFTPVFQSNNGIAGYDLMSPSDRLFAFDYTAINLNKDIVAYRPGTGILYILENFIPYGIFGPVYNSSAGIGSFDLLSSADTLVGFDADGAGSFREIAAYRPGTGIVQIINIRQSTTLDPFIITYYASPINSAGVGGGIGEYDLLSPADQLVPFDYSSSGKLNYLAAYRPGTGIVWILQFLPPSNFAAVFASPYDSTTGFGGGIGGYDLRSSADQLVAFDYDSDSKPDHLMAYRPGTGIVWILSNANGAFFPAYQSTYNP